MMDLTPIGPAAMLLAASKAAEPYLLKVLGAPLEQVAGMLASPIEAIRKRRSERLARIAASAGAQIEASGVEPIQIPDYIAIPLIEKATLVDDEGLQEMWASLLANASHPERAPSVSQMFPTMLAGLTPRHAKFLEIYFNASVYSIFLKIRPIAASVIASHSRMSEAKLGNVVGNSSFRWTSNDEKAATIDNLVNLGIMRRDREIGLEDFPKLAVYLLKQAGIKTPPLRIEGSQVPLAEDFCSITIAGAALVIACRPLDKRL
jgi:hypothetical protein